MTSPAPALSLFERLNAALPQTQCTRCGYPDCAAYAQAMASAEAAINQCPPGGADGVKRLAAITGLPALPLNPANGVEGPRAMAVIDENWCIGCTLCLDACPTDAILGSNKLMHTVIEAYCTGCELCIPVCPVDCISLENVTGERTGWDAWSAQEAGVARERYAFHSWRRPPDKAQRPETPPKEAVSDIQKAFPGSATVGNPPAGPVDAAADQKRAVIAAALARARAQRQTRAD